ncbi:hypothetical protein WDW86_17370 [Bdellovibrionota bacterium FG-2]
MKAAIHKIWVLFLFSSCTVLLLYAMSCGRPASLDESIQEEPFIDAMPSKTPDDSTQIDSEDPSASESPDPSSETVDEEPWPEPSPIDDGYRAVVGNAMLASQCPYGMSTQLVPVNLGLWDCPLEGKKIELSKPLRGMIIQADCYKKVIGIRTSDGSLDTSWEVMPDGTFFVAVDGGTIDLKADATREACSSPLTAEFWGKLTCADRDKVDITLHIDWSFQKFTGASPSPSPLPSTTPSAVPSTAPSTSPSPGPSTSPSPSPIVSPSPRPTPHVFEFVIQPSEFTGEISSEKQCKLPSTCHLYTTTIMRQCR